MAFASSCSSASILREAKYRISDLKNTLDKP